MDAEDVHLLARCLEVGRDRIVPRLTQQLEVRDEERRAVRRQRAARALNEAQELRDVSSLLFDKRGVGIEVSCEQLRAIKELEEEMLTAANNLEFEKAALLRDQVRELKRMLPGGDAGAATGGKVSYGKGRGKAKGRR